MFHLMLIRMDLMINGVQRANQNQYEAAIHLSNAVQYVDIHPWLINIIDKTNMETNYVEEGQETPKEEDEADERR